MVITIDVLLKICASIGCIGVAMGYIMKVYGSLKKPVDDISAKFKYYDTCLKNDAHRMDMFEKALEESMDCNRLLLESVYTMLKHFKDGNNTKMLEEKEKKIEEYLLNKVK